MVAQPVACRGEAPDVARVLALGVTHQAGCLQPDEAGVSSLVAAAGCSLPGSARRPMRKADRIEVEEVPARLCREDDHLIRRAQPVVGALRQRVGFGPDDDVAHDPAGGRQRERHTLRDERKTAERCADARAAGVAVAEVQPERAGVLEYSADASERIAQVLHVLLDGRFLTELPGAAVVAETEVRRARDDAVHALGQQARQDLPGIAREHPVTRQDLHAGPPSSALVSSSSSTTRKSGHASSGWRANVSTMAAFRASVGTAKTTRGK